MNYITALHNCITEKIDIKNIGLDLATVGTIISMIGVLYNNALLDHITAMWLWVPSNTIFAIYFYGRANDLWDGGLSDTLLCLNYLVMLVSGVWGLMMI
jgi:hypothetical protein